MIPLKTLPDAPRKPFWTRVLAVSIALVWLVQLGLLWFRGVDLISAFGVRPACFFHPTSCGVAGATLPPTHLEAWLRWASSPFGRLALAPFVSMWLHASWWHVGGNLLFLLVFGGAVEGELGWWRFLRLYLGGGLLATACDVLFNAGSSAATIGASGAIAALLGAYFWRLPRAWVLTYFPPVFLLPVPAWLWGVLWLGFQVVGAYGALHLPWIAVSGASGVAWTAHLGGFAWGAWVGWRSQPRRRRGSGKRGVSRASSNVGK